MSEEIRLPDVDRADLEKCGLELLRHFKLFTPAARTEKTWQPDRPAKFELAEDQIVGSLLSVTLDPMGKDVERIAVHGKGTQHAFDKDGVKLLDELSERWALHSALSEFTTTDAMRGRLLKWCEFNVHLGAPSSCVDSVMSDFHADLGEHEVWVQLAGIEVEVPFPMGPVEIRGVDGPQIESWLGNLKIQGIEQKQIESARSRYVEAWQGHTGAVFRALGDRSAVQSSAIEHAERACALMRVIDPRGANPTGRSFLQPVTLLSQSLTRQVMTDPHLTSCSLRSGLHEFEILSHSVTRANVAQLWNEASFGAAHALLSAQPRSQFQEHLIGASLIQARQRLTRDPVEKLIFTIASMETILYGGDRRSDQRHFKRRLCGLLAGTESMREHVFDTAKRSFELRNQFLHHGQRLRELRVIESFLLLSWLFFRALLAHQGRWSSVEEFIGEMDAAYAGRFPDQATS